MLPLQGGEVILHLVILVELALDVIVDGDEFLGSGKWEAGSAVGWKLVLVQSKRE